MGVYEVGGQKYKELVAFIEATINKNNTGLMDISNASVKQQIHLMQLIESGQFQHFDYGEKENLKRYGQKTPPIFDLRAITKVPIGMFVGKLDPLADSRDARKELRQIKSDVFYQEYDNLDHGAFTTGHMSYLNDLVELLKKYAN